MSYCNRHRHMATPDAMAGRCQECEIAALRERAEKAEREAALLRENLQASEAPCDNCQDGVYSLDGKPELCSVCVPSAAYEQARKAERERDSLAADYQRIIREVLTCEPKPASDRPEDQLEPPWEVIKRVRQERDEAHAKLNTICPQCQPALGPGCYVCRCQCAEAKLDEAHEDVRALATVLRQWTLRELYERHTSAAWQRIRDRKLLEVSE